MMVYTLMTQFSRSTRMVEHATVLISNQSISPCFLECGRHIARAHEVDVEPSRDLDELSEQAWLHLAYLCCFIQKHPLMF